MHKLSDRHFFNFLNRAKNKRLNHICNAELPLYALFSLLSALWGRSCCHLTLIRGKLLKLAKRGRANWNPVEE